MDKRRTIMSCTTLDELLAVMYCEVGTKMRDEFNLETEAFCQEQTNREECLRVDSSQET